VPNAFWNASRKAAVRFEAGLEHGVVDRLAVADAFEGARDSRRARQ
jgi:hypothetical protein